MDWSALPFVTLALSRGPASNFDQLGKSGTPGQARGDDEKIVCPNDQKRTSSPSLKGKGENVR